MFVEELIHHMISTVTNRFNRNPASVKAQPFELGGDVVTCAFFM